MLKPISSGALAGALLFAAGAAPAQEAATVQISQDQEHGSYLTDGEGRALYMFTADTQGMGGTDPTISCSGDCLQAWPPLTSAGEPVAGDMANELMLGTVEHDGETVVTYNGWPLYHFTRDQGPGQTAGQEVESFGGEWYLVSPEGMKVEG